MTTILYTPGHLTADSRTTRRTAQGTIVVADDTAKIRRFCNPAFPLDETERLSYRDDVICLAAGAGNTRSIHQLLDNLCRYGDGVDKVYQRAKRAFGTHVHVGTCTLLLVGEQHLHEIRIANHAKSTHVFTEQQLSLQEPHAIGSGGDLALMLHRLFRVPPILAVAAGGLIDTGTGGNVVDCERRQVGERGVEWMETLTRYVDQEDLLDSLTDYFADWNVGTHPFELLGLPKRKRGTRALRVSRARRSPAAK